MAIRPFPVLSAFLCMGALCNPIWAVAGSASYFLVWSGTSQGNSASAHALLTIDDALFPTSSPLTLLTPGIEITDFQIEVSGADSDDGFFQLSDYSAFTWSTTATDHTPVSLDLSQELVGQPTLGGPWGSTQDYESSTGDFNLIANNDYAPTLAGTSFTLATRNGYRMQLVSFVSSVPEPEQWGMMLLGIPFTTGVINRTRRKQRRTSKLRFASKSNPTFLDYPTV